MCCNGSPTLGQAQAQTLSGLLGVPISLVTANAALGCTPVSVVDGGVDWYIFLFSRYYGNSLVFTALRSPSAARRTPRTVSLMFNVFLLPCNCP